MIDEDKRRIDVRRLIQPIDEAPTPVDKYGPVMRSDFISAYLEGRDAWTEEREMREAAVLLDRSLDTAADILDVGAGRGRDTAFLLERGHRVTAIDIVESAEWKSLQRTWGERVRFEVASLMDFAGRDAFDAILDNGCLHHQHPTEYESYLDRVSALLRPTGLFTISVFRAASRGRLYMNEGKRLYRDFGDSELEDLLSRAGLDPVDRRQIRRAAADLDYLVLTARKPAP